MNKIKQIEPSLLSLDPNKKIAIEQIKYLKKAGIETVHYDLMDGKLVPNKSFTKMQYLSLLNELGLKVNIHLMVNNPRVWAKKCFAFHPNAITFQVETYKTIETSFKIIKLIKQQGIKAGVAIKCTSDFDKYQKLLFHCDFITFMSVEPGLGGQKFNECVSDNLQKADKVMKFYPKIIVQLDGGVNMDIIKKYYDCVNNFIMGSYVFKDLNNLPKILKEFNCINK